MKKIAADKNYRMLKRADRVSDFQYTEDIEKLRKEKDWDEYRRRENYRMFPHTAIESMGLEKLKSSVSTLLRAAPQYWDTTDPRKPKCIDGACKNVDTDFAYWMFSEHIPQIEKTLQEGPNPDEPQQWFESDLASQLMALRKLLGRELGGVNYAPGKSYNYGFSSPGSYFGDDEANKPTDGQ
tara:strand:- start:3171 stop:3716 length:546 start_codon:yes stop_codon:yes gene_type:complete